MKATASDCRAAWAGRVAIAVLLAAVLSIGFAGYLHPDMQLDWAALAQLCGLR
jgi:hypothetical protein